MSDVKSQFYDCYYIKKMQKKDIITSLNISESQYRYLQSVGVKPPSDEITLEFLESESMKFYRVTSEKEKPNALKTLIDVFKLKPKPKPKDEEEILPTPGTDLNEFSK